MRVNSLFCPRMGAAQIFNLPYRGFAIRCVAGRSYVAEGNSVIQPISNLRYQKAIRKLTHECHP
jgi:hypothetical protein